MSVRRPSSPLVSYSTGSENASFFEEMDMAGNERSYSAQPLRQMNGTIHHSPSLVSHQSDSEHYRLLKKIRYQICIFYLVVTLSFLVMVVYIGLIVFLITMGARMNENSNPLPQRAESRGANPSQSGKYPYCVQKEDVMAHSDVYESMRHENKFPEVCFQSLEWMPKLVERVNSSIQDRAAMIEDKHRKMNADLDNISMSFNRTPGSARLGAPPPNRQTHTDLINRRHPVFAHLYLNRNGNHNTALKWSKAGIDESNRQRLGVNMITGEIVIREAGSYFVYSHVAFRNENGAQLFHTIEKNIRGSTEVLLEGSQGPTSILQGVFKLKMNDTLAVKAAHKHLNTDSPRSTFFGMYLMKT